MSVSSEVQRTLVKSPPELWAELSDPTTLARHLGELGEIRIVATEPDRAVDWEAAAADGALASGRVEIEPSGWGTKVKLSANRLLAEAAPEAEAASAFAFAPKLEPAANPSPAAEPEPEPAAKIEAVEVIAEPEPEPELTEPAPRPGFFARFFRRRRKPQPEPVGEPELEAIGEPEAEPVREPEAVGEPEAEAIAAVAIEEAASVQGAPEPDISAEPAELEEQTTAVLTGVLDRLGAAHHRPFSRS